MNSPDQPCQTTPAGDLRQQILDSRVPKNEREWWAAREIEKLERELTAANAELAIAENWVEHHSKHADDLISENVRLRAEVERWKTVAAQMTAEREHNANEASRLRAELQAKLAAMKDTPTL